jgi:hypothetical protein
MEFVLLVVIILQFAYMVYKDFLFHKEREKLELKLMSDNVVEYTRAVEKQPEATKQEEPVYHSVDDVSTERLLEAEFKA